MSRIKHLQFWVALVAMMASAELTFCLVVYYTRPSWLEVPKFSVMQVALYFVISLPFSIASRFYANWKSDQEELNISGFINSVRDSVHGWYFFYLTSPIGFILWDLLFYGTFPSWI